jgi:tetratricopeptide (TPR) repeat protein
MREPGLLGPPFPAESVEPRTLPGEVRPVLPRGVTTDIPEQLIDQIVMPRRLTLADRALAARWEGAGDRLIERGQFTRAVERYQQAIAKAPDQDEVKFKLGAALLAARQYEQAGQVLHEALRQRPDWPHVQYDLRNFFADAEVVRRIVDSLEHESRQPDAGPNISFLYGYVLYFSGEREAAEFLFRNPPQGPAEQFDIFLRALERERAR